MLIRTALDYVALEESCDQFINPGQIFGYIGERKGIQGHQNSTYLDTAVFGLFAVSDVFDNMFLEQKAHDPVGDEIKYVIWKEIVNPLRKYVYKTYIHVHMYTLPLQKRVHYGILTHPPLWA